jgi:hypothetical protein
MDAAPSTSSHGNLKTFRASNLTDDEVCEILQTCESEESDTELSDRDSYSDIDREPEVDRHEIDDSEVVRCSTKQKKISNKKSVAFRAKVE